MKTTLPADSSERKKYPIFSGVLRYAPAALALMAKTSKDGNDKHNPGEELHHARGKSTDHGDCALRHLFDVQDLIAVLDRAEGLFNRKTPATELEALATELGQLQWRVSLYVQETAEKYLGYPLAPGARLPKAEATPPKEQYAFPGHPSSDKPHQWNPETGSCTCGAQR